MKYSVVLVSVFAAVVASAAVPKIDNVVMNGGVSKTTVTYDLSGVAGIVTMEIQTNTVADLSGEWLPLDGQLLRNAQGDVSCVVQPGIGHKITWPSGAALGAMKLKRARAVLTAWSTNAPPDYCVADLSGNDVPRYYTSTNYFPYGFGHLTYKTTNIVFKLVKAKGCSFCAGEFSVVDTYGGSNPHVINMTRDYYLGIYELTQAQYHWATGKKSPWNTSYWPTDKLYYDSPAPASIGWRDNWRTGCYTDVPSSGSFIGAMRAKTGLYAELPTCAQWEFALRCGGYRTPDGRQVVEGGEKVANIYDVANVNSHYGSMIEVGQLQPNMWGFYDMIGNVTEMCLDWVHVTSNNNPDPITEETTDPMGLSEGGNGYPYMGASFGSSYAYSGTFASTYGQGQNGYGTRIAVMLEPPTVAPVASAVASGMSVSPSVSSVVFGQDRANRNFIVTYALNKHAIVTWTLETNAVANADTGWVTVPEGTTNTRIWGDVNRLVEKTGSCSFCWSPDETWSDQLVTEGRARAVLTAWPTNNPPLYMVADTVGPIVNYYTSTNALPGGGLSNPVYSTRKLVFRKIPAKDVIWTMGVPEYINDESYSQWSASNRTNNTPHKVKLTYDYYAAINEFSRAQWCWVMNSMGGYGWVSSHFSLTNDYPVGGFYRGSLRSSAMGTGTLCGRLRLYHGSRYAFDLLSSAEWEYAYRAGEPKTLYTGRNWTWANLLKAGIVDAYGSGVQKEVQRVFEGIPPNRWGLYHMLGNFQDSVRDNANPLSWTNNAGYINTGIAVDPEDPQDSGCSTRGGQRSQWYIIQAGGNWNEPSTAVGNGPGLRLMCPIPKNAD